MADDFIIRHFSMEAKIVVATLYLFCIASVRQIFAAPEYVLALRNICAADTISTTPSNLERAAKR